MTADLTFRRVLIPLDGSEKSLKAARFGLRFARKEGATVIGVHVVDEENAIDLARYTDSPVEEIVARMEQRGKEYLETFRDWARKQGIPLLVELRVGVPYRELLKVAGQAEADLVVMGSVGRRGPRRVLVGSVTERLIAHSSIPVLVVK